MSGWQISGIMSKTTGPPLLLQTGSDWARVGGSAFTNQRPNLNPGFTADSIYQGDRLQWYNPAAFSLEPEGTEGNLGRNVIRGPGLFNLDTAVLKDTKIREQISVQFLAEFFNILNHTNFGTPNLALFAGTAVNPAAGLITNTNPGTTSRQIQFALKFVF